MKAVFWAGGLGTRMREETQFRPKPMVEIGGKPILWHLMQYFNHFGHNDFVVAGGYRVEDIKKYFLDYPSLVNDFTINTSSITSLEVYDSDKNDDNWNVTVADTGFKTLTSGRLNRVRKYLQNESEPFFCTYGDSLADVDLEELLKFHKKSGKIATVTVSHPRSRFGVFEADNNSIATKFMEKPTLDILVNSGFFIIEPRIFGIYDEIISENNTNFDNVMFEDQPLNWLVKNGELAVFKHNGFYQPIDTPREIEDMNNLWNNEEAPWKVW